MQSLVEQAQHAERLGQPERARALYERALYLLPMGNASPTASAVLRWVGRTYQVEARYEEALDCVEAALAVAELSGDDGAIGHATNLRAIVRWQQGDLDAAERDYRDARASALRAGDARLSAMTAQNLGVIANVHGDLGRALLYYQTSLADYRKLGLVHDICVALNNLGKLYTDTSRWTEARQSYEEALQISREQGDLPSQILLHVNIAELSVSQKRYDDAREACDRAMALLRGTQDTSSLGEIHRFYGVIARETGQPEEAERQLLEAERFAASRQDLLLQAQIARELAELYRRIGRNRDILQYLNRAYHLFSQLRARRDVAEVARRTTSLEGEFLEIVRRWGDSIESKDVYTQGHCERVADLACALAARTGMDERTLFWFRIGALLHDVGKLVISAELLNKPGRLDADEWEIMRSHPSAGVEMVSDTEFPWDVRPIIESHHENWDGSGYPHGLAGEAIPVSARILCIADVYDALTSERSYKKALPHQRAMEIMRESVGKQFDPDLFVLFEEVLERDPAAAPLLVPRTVRERRWATGINPDGPS